MAGRGALKTELTVTLTRKGCLEDGAQEEVLQLLVGVVDAQLLEAVHLWEGFT
jgi:hypothetical protein